MRANQLYSALMGETEIHLPHEDNEVFDRLLKETEAAVHEKNPNFDYDLARKQLIDILPKRRVIRPTDKYFNMCRNAAELLKKAGKFVFDFDSCPEIDSKDVIEPCLNLPFQRTYFEAEEKLESDSSLFVTALICEEIPHNEFAADRLGVSLFHRDTKNKWCATFYVKHSGVWHLIPYFSVVSYTEEEGLTILSMPHRQIAAEVHEDDGLFDSVVKDTTKKVIAFLHMLSCSNIDKVEIKPSKQHVKSALKKGKQPPFSYHVIKLPAAKRKGYEDEFKTLDKNSPRLHFRRGHVRHCHSGKITWVDSHMVGREENGVIEKHYEYVKPEGA